MATWDTACFSHRLRSDKMRKNAKSFICHFSTHWFSHDLGQKLIGCTLDWNCQSQTLDGIKISAGLEVTPSINGPNVFWILSKKGIKVEEDRVWFRLILQIWVADDS